MTQVAPISQRLWTIASKFPQNKSAKIALVGLALLVTSCVRWILAPLLGDSLPFFFYLPTILATTAFLGLRAGFVTLVSSLFLAVSLWMPEFSWRHADLAEALTLAGWFFISALLVYAIGLVQKSTAAQRQLIQRLHRTS